MRVRGTNVLFAAFGLGAVLAVSGCKSKEQFQPVNEAQLAAQNPNGLGLLDANGNYAGQPYQTASSPAPRKTQVLGQSYYNPDSATYEDYDDPNYSDVYSDLDGTNDPYAEYVDSGIPYASEAPPPIPQYEQPYAPGPNYEWTPGYWSYANNDYYWVPGAWVQPPYTGALWTPGFWGYYGGRYRYHHGYWGRNVGFYGGVNLGFGYLGVGYGGGYWNGDNFYYNSAYNRVRPEIVRNYVYNRPVVLDARYINRDRVSYWGGPRGIRRAPLEAELVARAQRITPPMRMQVQNRDFAMRQPQQFFRSNRGTPQLLSASTGFQADRGIQRPPAIAPAVMRQQINNIHEERVRWAQQHGRPANAPNVATPGFMNRPENTPPAWGRNAQQVGVQPGSPNWKNETLQRQQMMQQQQANVRQQQQMQEMQRQQLANQQRMQQANVQHQQQQLQMQQRQQADQQQRAQQMQRQQQQQANVQREQQMNMQRQQQQLQQRQQADQLRTQQMQQRQVEQQQHAQQQQMQMQQRQQAEQQQRAQQQANVQREQQMNLQRQQQMQQRQQAEQQQRAAQMQQQQAARAQQEQARAQQQQARAQQAQAQQAARAQQMQQHAAPQVQHAAPAPQMHAAPQGGGHGGEHGHH